MDGPESIILTRDEPNKSYGDEAYIYNLKKLEKIERENTKTNMIALIKKILYCTNESFIRDFIGKIFNKIKDLLIMNIIYFVLVGPLITWVF